MEISRGVSGPLLQREQVAWLRTRALSTVLISAIQKMSRKQMSNFSLTPLPELGLLRLCYLPETSSPLPCFSQTPPIPQKQQVFPETRSCGLFGKGNEDRNSGTWEQLWCPGHQFFSLTSMYFAEKCEMQVKRMRENCRSCHTQRLLH